ncbi:MAG: hypothetical protein ACOYOU_05950, partial [Kiritimatiellia bacterium]
LANCYLRGNGVTQDALAACCWFAVAAAKGDAVAAAGQRLAEAGLSADQVLAARNWANAWKPGATPLTLTKEE